jgi:signal transduction histidine kinase
VSRRKVTNSAAAVASENRGERIMTNAMAPGDMVELFQAFNEATRNLQAAHESLQKEVERLSRELREANEQVERSRRLAALGEMAAGIAHEVRNPLGSIRLYAGHLSQDLNDPHKAVAGKILGAVRQAEQVVNDVLSFSREFRLRHEPLDAHDVLHRALEAVLAEGRADWQRAHVAWNIQPDVVRFQGDANLLHQAMVNVIRNALEAMDEAKVRPALELSAFARGEHAYLRVRDAGPGIAPDVVARMFNPFFTTRSAGTGLGLSIVHRIVDAHAGRIIVGTNPPETGAFAGGACVEVVLPGREEVAPCVANSARLSRKERTTPHVGDLRPSAQALERIA